MKAPIDSSASSSSSAAAQPAQTKQPLTAGLSRQQRNPGPTATALSPKQRAELAKLSPRLKKGGSDGTPSMGSSFSDLDGKSMYPGALIRILS